MVNSWMPAGDTTQQPHGYEVLKHAFAISVGPENYALVRNASAIERNEDSYGEMFGIAFKSMIAAGPCSAVIYSRQVPKTWWDHLKMDLLAWLKVERPLYDDDKLDEDDLVQGKSGPLIGHVWKCVLWHLLKFNTETIATREEHKHLCPHVDIDFKENPAPHYEWLLKEASCG